MSDSSSMYAVDWNTNYWMKISLNYNRIYFYSCEKEIQTRLVISHSWADLQKFLLRLQITEVHIKPVHNFKSHSNGALFVYFADEIFWLFKWLCNSKVKNDLDNEDSLFLVLRN